MNTIELYRLTTWVEDEVKNRNITGLYQQLITVISQNVSPRNNQQLQPFEEQKSQLIEELKGIDLYRLSKEQLSILSKARLLNQIGKPAADNIEEIFMKKGLDLATILKDLQQMKSQLDSGMSLLDTTKKNLGVFIDDKIEDVDSGCAVVKIHFQNNADIGNIVELRKWMNDWYDISRGIAISQEEAPESIRVLSAEKGSFIITLGIAYSLVEVVSKIVMRVLEVVEKSLDIKKKALEIKGLELQNQKIAQDLEIAAKSYKKDKIQEIVDEYISMESDGEKKTALEKAVKKLISFTEKGGEVDCFIPPSDIEDDSDKKDSDIVGDINRNFRTIRKIETKIRSIEYFE